MNTTINRWTNCTTGEAVVHLEDDGGKVLAFLENAMGQQFRLGVGEDDGKQSGAQLVQCWKDRGDAIANLFHVRPLHDATITTADRQIDLGGGVLYDAIDDAANGLTCVYPTDGPNSIQSIVARYGDDIDVLLSSATYYLSVDGSPAVLDCSDLF